MRYHEPIVKLHYFVELLISPAFSAIRPYKNVLASSSSSLKMEAWI